MPLAFISITGDIPCDVSSCMCSGSQALCAPDASAYVMWQLL